MRLPLILVALAISVPAASEAPLRSGPAPDAAAATSAVVRTNPVANDTCRTKQAHFARGGSVWRDQPVRPRKLDELPDATAYMAVYRTIDGCEEPLTVVEYRNSSGR